MRATDSYTSYFMINCAHPQHFKNVIASDTDWSKRIRGLRANASTKSHAELDDSEHLDAGDKCALSQDYVELRSLLPNLNVLGGCCGTDHTHIAEISKLWFEETSAV